MAIENFREHAANERSFLAWVRTSIGIVGFGFLIARFDVHSRFAHIAGLLLIVLGTAMIGVSAWRFRRISKEIDSGTTYPGAGSRADLALAALLVLLCAGLLFYLFNALSPRA
jgi:putative membrane protein